MGQPIRALVWISGLLAVGSFGYVLIYSPLPPETEQRRFGSRGGPRLATFRQHDWAFKQSMVQDQPRAAENRALQMIDQHPEQWGSWLNFALILDQQNREADARDAWGELMVRVESTDSPDSAAGLSRRAYFLGWANWGLSNLSSSEDLFCEAAGLYEGVNAQGLENPSIAYNLACYWSMGGEHDRALGYWESAVSEGFDLSTFWWARDPDLDPIRDDPRFMQAVRASGLEMSEAP
jgi:hypothetical protein